MSHSIEILKKEYPPHFGGGTKTWDKTFSFLSQSHTGNFLLCSPDCNLQFTGSLTDHRERGTQVHCSLGLTFKYSLT